MRNFFIGAMIGVILIVSIFALASSCAEKKPYKGNFDDEPVLVEEVDRVIVIEESEFDNYFDYALFTIDGHEYFWIEDFRPVHLEHCSVCNPYLPKVKN